MKVLRSVVLSMCRIATYFFPEVLSVISDISLLFPLHVVCVQTQHMH
jgi:hypothetical protein